LAAGAVCEGWKAAELAAGRGRGGRHLDAHMALDVRGLGCPALAAARGL